ncbi:unnamed protein product [Ectocarpus fasciculatus]
MFGFEMLTSGVKDMTGSIGAMTAAVAPKAWSSLGVVVSGAKRIPISVGLGAAAGLSAPSVAAMLVPPAMSYFGVIIPGIGTMHAIGGVAATLQSFATTSAVTSGAVGASVAATSAIATTRAWFRW